MSEHTVFALSQDTQNISAHTSNFVACEEKNHALSAVSLSHGPSPVSLGFHKLVTFRFTDHHNPSINLNYNLTMNLNMNLYLTLNPNSIGLS